MGAEATRTRASDSRENAAETSRIPNAQPGGSERLDGLRVTELRVHGVGGATPADILGIPDPELVAGDRIAGFYRGVRIAGREVEAYSWGGLTSRRATRALWLPLLPFALANLAGWMLRGRHPLPRGLLRLFSLALTVTYVAWTAVLVLDLTAYQCGGQAACRRGRWWLAPFGNHLVAPDPTRRLALGALLPLASLALLWLAARTSRDRYEGYRPMVPPAAGAAPPTATAGPAAATPAATDAGSPANPSAQVEAGPPAATAVQVEAGAGIGAGPAGAQARASARATDAARARGLGEPHFWDGQAFAGTLTHLHLSAALAMLTVIVASAALALDGRADRPMPPLPHALLWAALAAALLLLAAAATATLAGPNATPRPLVWFQSSRPWLALAVLALAGTVMWAWPPAGFSAHPLPQELPALRPLNNAIFIAGLAPPLLAALCMAAAFLVARGRRRQPDGQRFRGSWLVPATLAHAVLDALFAGAAIRVASLLGHAQPGGYGPPAVLADRPAGAVLVYRPVYGAFAFWLLALPLASLVATAAGWYLLGWRPHRERLLAEVAADRYLPAVQDPDGGPGGLADADLAAIPPGLLRSALSGPLRDGWLRRTARWWSWSSLVDGLDRILVAMLGVGIAVTAVYLIGFLVTGREPALFLQRLQWLVTFSTVTLGWLPLAGLALFFYAFRDPLWRRRVGVLWDVATFWPRGFHPLAPPCYAERAVPELQQRITWLAAGDRRVILSAHSQGTALALAALVQLDPDVRRRVAFVSYGCPLARLYRRAFPAFMGEGCLAALWRDLNTPPLDGITRWKNFWRRTDLVGGPVFCGEDQLPAQSQAAGWLEQPDQLLTDPWTDRYVLPDPPPPVRGHLHYLEDPTVERFLRELTTRL